jgi:hypothetical protein
MNDDRVKFKKREKKAKAFQKMDWLIYTLIILFSEMLKFSKFFFFQATMICEGKYEIFKNILFVKINISRLINYLTKHVWKLPRILHVMGEKR